MKKTSVVRRYKRYQNYRPKRSQVEQDLGLKLRSGFERTVAAQLKRAGVEFEYETLAVPYIIKHVYNPDFILPNGIIIEVKGYFRNGDIAKMKAVKAQNPELDIRFCFMYADKKIPGQKQTHEQWCDRHGFPWCVAEIPESWLSE